jgi:secreted trypsin-like serine protease
LNLFPIFSFYLIILTSFTDAPIIGRHDVDDSAYIKFAKELPVTASVVKYNSTDVAGTLISDQWVLSAAHVGETIKPGQKLILGKDSLEVEKIIIHPGWLEHNRPEDIALIRLKNKVPYFYPVELYSDTNEINKEVIIIGNGDFGTGLTGPKGNDGKFRAATNLVDEATDFYLKWNFDDPREKSVRATALEGISGPGDSSGPAFIKLNGKIFIAGISSGQSTKATNGKEGVYGVTEYYTRVSSYVKWIESIVTK